MTISTTPVQPNERAASDAATMRAIAVRPGTPGSIHVRTVRLPVLDDIPDGRGVLVEVLRVGLDGTDKEISQALYGMAPAGDDFLIVGHENLGRVIASGPNVPPELRSGALVVSTVRRPGHSPYDQLGMQDFTTDTVYYERGINLRHGYLSEFYVEDAAYVVQLPPTLERVGVLMEPLTVAEKGINQANEIQRRLRIWRPARSLVIGAGTIGLLASLVLRLEGIDVTVLSRRRAPYRNSDLLDTIGARYVSSTDTDVAAAAAAHGPLRHHLRSKRLQPARVRGSGIARYQWRARLVRGNRRRARDRDRRQSDQPGLRARQQGHAWNRERIPRRLHPRRRPPARGRAMYPGWLEQLLTTPVHGLEDPAAILAALDDRETIKAFVEVAASSAMEGDR